MKRFFLVPTPETKRLADHQPDLGRSWNETMAPLSLRRWRGKTPTQPLLPLALFSNSDWRPLQHVLVHALAHHRLRELTVDRADFCITATPAQAGLYPSGHPERARQPPDKGGCGSVGEAWHAWRSLCPHQKPLLVIDVVDADYRGFRLCPALWQQKRCENEQSASVVRVVGSPPMTAHPGEREGKHRKLLASCPSVSVPWLSHAREPISLPSGHARTFLIAGAYSTFQHGVATLLGWADWRRDLRNACGVLGKRNASLCVHKYQSMSGLDARTAVELYARSVFCLQPPGDVIARGAIVDAISVGCIPVFFHPAQQRLWPLHWDGTRASILFDWTDMHVRNATATSTNREEIGLAAALAVMQNLMGRSDAEIERLQRAVRVAGQRMIYRVRHNASTAPPRVASGGARADAVDVLLQGLARHLYSKRNLASLPWSTVAASLRPAPLATLALHPRSRNPIRPSTPVSNMN
jgi:hypothetical protein